MYSIENIRKRLEKTALRDSEFWAENLIPNLKKDIDSDSSGASHPGRAAREGAAR
jgi:hypothetical protein